MIPKTMYISRHGQVDFEKSISMQEQNDKLSISELGSNQIDFLANYLKKNKDKYMFDIIITSNTKRTIESSTIISKILGIETIVDNNFNPWEVNAKDVNEYYDIYQKFISSNCEITNDEKFESFVSMKKRLINGFEKIQNNKYINNPLIISHSIIISLIVGITRHGIHPGGLYKIPTNAINYDYIKKPNFKKILY